MQATNENVRFETYGSRCNNERGPHHRAGEFQSCTDRPVPHNRVSIWPSEDSIALYSPSQSLLLSFASTLASLRECPQ